MKTFLMVTYRYLVFFFYLARCFICILLLFPFKPVEERFSILKHWAINFFKCVNFRVDVEGNSDIHNMGSLCVANHISYFDPIILILFDDFRFIANSGVKDWPLIGRMTESFELIYIDRNKAETANKVAQVVNVLNDKHNVMLFPEGTTSEENSIRPFKNSYFQAAIDAKTTTTPIVLRYLKADGTSNSAFNFTDNRNFFRVMTDVFKIPETIIKVTFLEPIPYDSVVDRFELTDKTHTEMVKVFKQWS
ncbi:hypothetical protein GKC56_07285 [Neisseriaceae bacterium PsAf]|nr:hypothetical protein [Neisseriaceae bacterium PsAf]MCV2503207.1 1-acyl-sn-glycerol-3-phosphate acyltransferase [Neisseriaceae bacterium]